MTNSAVKSTSTMIAAPRPKPPGESSFQPLLAKPPSWALLSQPSGPNRPIRTTRVVATRPPTIWAMMYGPTFRHGKRPAAASPRVTAGLKWPPEIGPNA